MSQLTYLFWSARHSWPLLNPHKHNKVTYPRWSQTAVTRFKIPFSPVVFTLMRRNELKVLHCRIYPLCSKIFNSTILYNYRLYMILSGCSSSTEYVSIFCVKTKESETAKEETSYFHVRKYLTLFQWFDPSVSGVNPISQNIISL